MIGLDSIKAFVESAGPDLRKVYITVVRRGKRTDVGTVNVSAEVENGDTEGAAFRLLDAIEPYQDSAGRVILDGRKAKSERCKYAQIDREAEEVDGMQALVDSLERQTRANVDAMSTLVEGNKALIVGIDKLTSGTIKALEQAASVVVAARDIFVEEMRGARKEAENVRKELAVAVTEKHEAEVAVAEATAEGQKESVFEFYMKNPDKVVAVVTLLKHAAKGLLTEGTKAAVETAAKVG